MKSPLCIKIGGILEYLLSKWLEDKNITPFQIISTKKKIEWKDVSFHKIIEFYMINSRKYADEIGIYTD